MEEKTCSKCLASKPETEFYRNGKHIRSACRSCVNAATKARTKPPVDLERRREHGRKYWERLKRDPVRYQAKKEAVRPVSPDRRRAYREAALLRLACDPEARKAYLEKKASYNARPDVKAARAEAMRQRNYGLLPGQYAAMVAEQGGCCAICKRRPSNKRTKDVLHVDHCHKTGAVRGLLCSLCNKGLGCFRDTPEHLLEAVKYLGGN